ncbi:LPS-assembly protein LptD [Hyphomicrobium sp.]|uniref:LPS-assembly protein LptD n=1 Tax=Hyphomicrobium sp. TaxID=82 RepID=UPI002E301FC5|nr:LPS-assembly protein LptD [Hyphomicrobium sp.]HEX2843040.1 LPS-assembly protein LptD [Hyphomicrobium sp.]
MRVARTLLAPCTEFYASFPRVKAAEWGRLRSSAFVRPALALALSLGLVAGAPMAAHAQKTTQKGLLSDSGTAFPEQPGGVFGKPQKLDKSLPLYLQGDELIYDNNGNRVIARGNVEIYYNKNVLTADKVIYDQSANTLTASGNVELKEANGNIIRADNYTLTDDFRDGFVQSLSVVTRDDSRITAERGERREGNVTEFSEATFTPCKSEGNVPPLWCIGAKRIIHDQAKQTISYQDAELKFYGITVGYLPYFEHPDPSVKRKSGFLSPSYGNSGDLGVFVELPYYFALSPSYDFTFTPRYMSEQGVMWQGEWRQKLANGEYNIIFAGIDQDAGGLPAPVNRNLEGWRGSIETHGKFSLSSWWSYGWNVIAESDDSFRRFYKLDSILLTDRVNDVWLRGLSDRSYFSAKLYQFGGLLVNDDDSTESLVHPIIDHNYVFQDPVLGGELTWTSNALSLSRSDSSNAAIGLVSQDMNRVVTEVKWRRRFTDAVGITYTPFGELRGDIYQINFEDDDPFDAVNSNLDDTFLRGLATGGVTVAYPWVASLGSTSHVIEPIGQLVAHNASVRQEGLPDEDAKSLIFDDTNLFETSKFSGYDRLETGVRANVGVQYTFQGPVGYARVLAGQSYHLSGDNAYNEPEVDLFNPRSGLETDKSDYVLGLYLAPTDVFRVIAQSRFDEDDLTLRREDLTAAFNYGPLLTQVTYTYGEVFNEDTLRFEQEEDILGFATLRLTDRWTLTGAIRYDLDNDKVLTDSIRLAYLDECFMLSATYTETFITDPLQDIRPDQVVMLRFELKHLGGFAYSTNVVDTLGGEDASARGGVIGSP